MHQAVGDRTAQAVCAFNLGVAYMDVAAVRDFDAAERWLQQSLDLLSPGDDSGRGKSLGQLGTLFLARFEDARAEGRPQDQCLHFLNGAAQNYQQSLELFPSTAIVELGTTHTQLGYILGEAGETDRALQHYRHAIRYREQAGDILGAGQARFYVAFALLRAQRLDDARAYAEAALANSREFGDRAAAEIQKAEQLIAAIDEAAAEWRGKA